MAWNPNTQQEDPSYVPPATGIIDSNTPTVPAPPPATGVGTTSISSGSVSEQLDQIFGPSTTNTSNPSTTTPAKWDVNSEQTVQGQIGGIINSNSPLKEQAKARSAEAANSRGLINSSMATQAGEAALYDAALPIATADAATYAQAAAANAGFGQQVGLAEQQQGFNVANMEKAAGIALGMYDTQLQGDMSKMATAQGFNLETMDAQQINDLAKAAVLQGYDLTKMDTAASQALELLDASTLADIQKMTEAGNIDLTKMDAQQINDLAKMSVDNQYKMDLLTADNDAKALLAELDNKNKIELANIQAEYQTLLGTNKTAADVFTSVLTNITSIQSDPKIDGLTVDADGKTAKDRAIETQTNMLQAAFGVIGGVAEIDLADLLGFDETTPEGGGMDMADATAPGGTLAERQAKWDASQANAVSNPYSPGVGTFHPRPTV